MSDLTVEMILSLVDSASPKLKLFRDALEGVNASAKTTSDSLQSTQVTLDAVTPTVEKVATATKLLASSSRTTARAMLGINERLTAFVNIAQRSMITLNQLSASMERTATAALELSASLGIARSEARGIATAFNTTFRALNKLGASADTNSVALNRLKEVLGGIAPEADALAGASVTAAGAIGGIGTAAEGADAKLAGMHGTMKGLIELYGALKIEEGLKKSVSDAATYQTEKLQLQQRNLAAGQYQAVLNQANQQALLHPWLTKNDALEAQIAALSELPGNTPFMQQMRAFMAPQLQYVARRARMYGDKTSFFHRIQNAAGIVDAMGAQQNPERAAWVTKDTGAVIAASGGKDTLLSMETSFRALSKVLSVNMGQAGFRFFNAGNEEFKSAGGGGVGGNTKMATLLNALTMAAAGGKMGKGAAYILAAAGLIHQSDIHKYGHSSTSALVSQGALLNSQQLLHDPGQFIFDTLVPHFEALIMKRWKEHKPGMVNPDTAAGLSQDTALLGAYFSKFGVGGQSLASAMGMFSNPEIKRSILAKERQMEQVQTNAQSSKGVDATAAGQWKIFNSQLHNLAVNIGTTLLPALTSILRVVNKLIVGFNGFVQAFPKTTMIATLVASIGGLVLALKGLASLLGLGKSFAQMFGLMSSSALGADAKIVAGSTATTAEVAANNLRMASSFAITGKGMVATAVEIVAGVGKTFLLGFASFAAGWELWQSIKNFQIAGHTLNAYAGVATMAIAQQFDAMFTYIENGFLRLEAWWDRLGARIDTALGFKGWAAQKNAAAQEDSATVAANSQAFTFRSHIRQSVAIQDWNSKHGSGDPTAPTGISPAEELHTADVAALPSVPGGELNPPTTGGSHSHAKAKANKAAEANQKAIDHLYSIADKSAAKATAAAAKMNAAAKKLHLAFMAMTNPAGAKITETNQKYSALAAQMTAAGHTGAAADALAIGHHKVLQYQYQDAVKKLHTLQGTLHMGITSNAALVTAGSMTRMEAGQADIALQKSMAPQMIKAAEAALQYAKALKDPALIQAMTEQVDQLKAMGKELGYYSAKVKDSFQAGLTGFFENLMHGQKTWGQMFEQLFAGIGKSIENTLAKSISQSITDSLMGKKANQGIGSIIGGISHWIGGLFGGSGSSGATAAHGGGGLFSDITAGGGFLKDLFSMFGSFAVGADNIPNDMVAQIHKGEMVIPAGPAAAIRAGQTTVASGGNHVHLTIHAMDSQSVISALHNVRDEAAQMFLNTAATMNLNGG